MCPDVRVGATAEVAIIQGLASDVVNNGVGVKLAAGFGGKQIAGCVNKKRFGGRKALLTVGAAG